MATRTHPNTLQMFTEACDKLSFRLVAGGPRTRQSTVTVQCPAGHPPFETRVDYTIRSAGGGTSGCRECGDQKHSDQARGIFLRELAEAGLEPHPVKPHYHYTYGGKRWNAQTFQKKSLGIAEGTERQEMERRGYLRIYDCGHLRFVKSL